MVGAEERQQDERQALGAGIGAQGRQEIEAALDRASAHPPTPGRSSRPRASRCSASSTLADGHRLEAEETKLGREPLAADSEVIDHQDSLAGAQGAAGRPAARPVATGRVTQKREPRPTSLSTPTSPPMSSDQPLDDREPESGAAVVARGGGIDLREGLEQPVEPIGRNPDAGIRSPRCAASRRHRPSRRLDTYRSTWPSWVNLTALPIRFMMIWRMRPGSPRASTGTSASMLTTSSMPLTAACSAVARGRVVDDVAQVEVDVLELQAVGFDLREVEHVVDQREERLRAAANDVDILALRMVELVSARICDMPITPFMGVRISWLTFARKLLFARLAASAASLASSAACSANLRSVTSCIEPASQIGSAVRIALDLRAQANPFVVPGLVQHADFDVAAACRDKLIIDRLLLRRRDRPDESVRSKRSSRVRRARRSRSPAVPRSAARTRACSAGMSNSQTPSRVPRMVRARRFSVEFSAASVRFKSVMSISAPVIRRISPASPCVTTAFSAIQRSVPSSSLSRYSQR